MKISTRIRLSALAAVLIALVAAVVLYLGARAVETALERNDRVAESLNQIFEISMLTTDYLVHYEPRAERQWREQHADLAPVLDALDVEEPEDRALVDRIRENQDEAFRLFDEITVAHAQGEQGVVDPAVSREYEARLTARLLIVMQSMVSDAVTLGDRSSEAARLAQQRTFLLVLVLSLVGVTVMIGIGWSTTHTVIRPLVTLRDSVRQVGLGKLDTRSGVRSADEVGELATAFDGMVADLQESYAMLEREVAERTAAQHELAQYRDHLEQLVEVRTSELVTVNEDLRQATRAKDDFMTSMSHELRTPLNSIIGFTDLMLKGLAGEVNEEQKRQLTMVLHSGQQLLALVNDVLDLARLEAGQAALAVVTVPLSEVVGNLAEMMSPLADSQHLTLGWSIDADVPASIETDRGKLEQIMLNLLSNAIKFTRDGAVDVRVRRSRIEEAILLEVTDTGIGIPATEIEAIFEHFRQASGQQRVAQQGTGLGLAISRRLAEALGGTISVTSVVGRGSTFTVMLPFEPPGA